MPEQGFGGHGDRWVHDTLQYREAHPRAVRDTLRWRVAAWQLYRCPMQGRRMFESAAIWPHVTWQARKFSVILQICRGVAQSGSVLAWGARGRVFESLRPDQKSSRAGWFIFGWPAGFSVLSFSFLSCCAPHFDRHQKWSVHAVMACRCAGLLLYREASSGWRNSVHRDRLHGNAARLQRRQAGWNSVHRDAAGLLQRLAGASFCKPGNPGSVAGPFGCRASGLDVP